jgi:hypothetical protein
MERLLGIDQQSNGGGAVRPNKTCSNLSVRSQCGNPLGRPALKSRRSETPRVKPPIIVTTIGTSSPRRPIMFTTNKSPLTAWGEVLHDHDPAEAIVDRVLEKMPPDLLEPASSTCIAFRPMPRNSIRMNMS